MIKWLKSLWYQWPLSLRCRSHDDSPVAFSMLLLSTKILVRQRSLWPASTEIREGQSYMDINHCCATRWPNGQERCWDLCVNVTQQLCCCFLPQFGFPTEDGDWEKWGNGVNVRHSALNVGQIHGKVRMFRLFVRVFMCSPQSASTLRSNKPQRHFTKLKLHVLN